MAAETGAGKSRGKLPGSLTNGRIVVRFMRLPSSPGFGAAPASAAVLFIWSHRLVPPGATAAIANAAALMATTASLAAAVARSSKKASDNSLAAAIASILTAAHEWPGTPSAFMAAYTQYISNCLTWQQPTRETPPGSAVPSTGN